MKKILAFVSLIVVVAACSAPPANREASTNANMAAPPKSATMSEADAIAKEKHAWDAIQKKDYEGFGSMLANDMVYVSSDAVYDKPGTINGVKGFEPRGLTFSDWKVLPVDKDAVAMTYTVDIKGNNNGKPMPPETIRASSAWVNRGGQWLSIYHQDCQIKKAMPPPTNTNKPAKATVTPAATPAMTATGADAIANEKMVWDRLRIKNYDGFAALLASDSLEVEPEAVYDKAGSVKGVSQYDFSKAVLSDWKVVKFDDDASLVTYLVKMPGGAPDGERHSTIWANRGGKWLALFHHGTPVMKAPPAAAPKASASPAAKASPKMKM